MLDLNTPPPKRWITQTIYEPERDDVSLAHRILADNPHFLYGMRGMNRYAHGGWAYQVLGDLDTAWELMYNITATADLFLSIAAPILIPTKTLFVFVWTAMRMNRLDQVEIGIRMLHTQRMSHTLSEREDLQTLTRELERLHEAR
jgi:hypothetical protein